MRNPTARLFVAVDPSEDVREALAGWGRRASLGEGTQAGGGAQLRVLDPELQHVTLCFLGNRPVGEIDLLGTQLATCIAPVGELSLGAPLWLPVRRPRVLAVELHDDDNHGLASLQAAVVDVVREASGWQASSDDDVRGVQGRFHPHITVARMGRDFLPRKRVLPVTPSLSFTPQELVLYRSWLAPEGASYEAVASHRLG